MNLQADLGGWRNELGGILPLGSHGESLMGRRAVEEKIIDSAWPKNTQIADIK